MTGGAYAADRSAAPAPSRSRPTAPPKRTRRVDRVVSASRTRVEQRDLLDNSPVNAHAAAAKQACLRAKLGTNASTPAARRSSRAAPPRSRPAAPSTRSSLNPGPRADRVHAAPLPQGRRRHAPGGHGVRPSPRPPRGPQGREPAANANRAADERQARIAAILKAMRARGGRRHPRRARAPRGRRAPGRSRGARHDRLPGEALPVVDAARRDSPSRRRGWGTARAAPAGPPSRLRARASGSSPWPDSLFSSSPELAQQLQRTMPRARRRRRGTRPRCARGPTPLIANTAATTRTRCRWSASERLPCCPPPPTLSPSRYLQGSPVEPLANYRYKCHLHGQY